MKKSYTPKQVWELLYHVYDIDNDYLPKDARELSDIFYAMKKRGSDWCTWCGPDSGCTDSIGCEVANSGGGD